MQKPSSRYPSSAGSFGSLTPSDLPDPSLNAEAYNDLIQNRGILFTHTVAMPCPNVQDVESMIHVNHCTHPRCWNGYLQVKQSKVWGYFNNDQLNKLYEIQGEYDENIAIVTLAAVDTDGNEAELHQFDQLVAEEYQKRVTEMVEASITGIDRLRYHALDVLTIETKEGKTFTKGLDYCVEDGKVRWLTQNRPGYDQQLGKGEVFSIAYYVRPTFYVHHVMKELRATQVMDPMTGEKVAVRLPQHIMVLRELVVPDDENKGDDGARKPRNGALSPR